MNFHFDLLAPLYEKVIGPPDLPLLRDALQLPAPAARLLDAGGGTGRVSAHLRPFVGQIVIADYSLGMLKQAKPGLNPLHTSVLALPFPSDSFNRILVTDALHHFPRGAHALGELARVLAPGGILVIEEMDIQHGITKFVTIAEKLALMTSHFFPPTQIAAILTDHGLHAQVAHRSGPYARIVATK